MPRRSRSSRSFRSSSRSQSDSLRPSAIVRRSLRYTVLAPSLFSNPFSNLDGRYYHPLRRNRPAVNRDGSTARIRVSRPTRRYRLPYNFSFISPRRVLVCIRRKQRRKVLFAKKRTRRGSGSSRRITRYSRISC